MLKQKALRKRRYFSLINIFANNYIHIKHVHNSYEIHLCFLSIFQAAAEAGKRVDVVKNLYIAYDRECRERQIQICVPLRKAILAAMEEGDLFVKVI